MLEGGGGGTISSGHTVQNGPLWRGTGLAKKSLPFPSIDDTKLTGI